MIKLKDSIKPRYYQSESIAAAMARLKESPTNKPLIVLPTGAGKALVTAMLSIMAINYNRRILHITHTKELVEQNALALINSVDGHVDVSVCSAGLNSYDLTHPVIYAGIQTLANPLVNRLEQLNRVDLLVIDEAHRISVDDDGQYQKVIDYLLRANPAMRIIGLTATPFRLSQGMLTWAVVKRGSSVPIPPLFNCIAYEAKTGDLIEQGYLSQIVSIGSAISPDLTDIKMTNGDYSAKEIGDKFETIIPSACREIKELVQRYRMGKIIVFASTVENAEHIASLLPNSRVVTGNSTDRDDSLDWFKAEIDYNSPKYLVNVQILTTGFNQPDIDCVVLLFATVSVGKYVQVVGRGLRLANGKECCYVLDYGTNIDRLGTIDNPIVKASGNGECPTKDCPECNALNLLAAKECHACGFKFPIVGGNDKYTGQSIQGALLDKQQIEYTAEVDSWYWSVHTSNNTGNQSLKLSLYDDRSELIINHYFHIRAEKSGWREHNIMMLKNLFFEDDSFYQAKAKYFNGADLGTIVDFFNNQYEWLCKPIRAVSYRTKGKYKEICSLDLTEFEEMDG